MLRTILPFALIAAVVIGIASYDLATGVFDLQLAIERILSTAENIYEFVSESESPTLVVTVIVGATLILIRALSIATTGR